MSNVVAVDTSHILYREFYRQVGDKAASNITVEDLDIIERKAIRKLRDYNRRLNGDSFVLAFDDHYSWRTRYSRDKGMRPYKSSTGQSLRQQNVQQVFNQLRAGFKAKVSRRGDWKVVSGRGLESDDLLAGIIHNRPPGTKIAVITSDQDLSQFLRYSNVSVINIRNGRKMKSAGVDQRLFDRIITGRHSYNVVSVFNRLPKEERERAFNDEQYLKELFKQYDKNDDSSISARQRFNNNSVLFDMDKQPAKIKRQVKKVLSSQNVYV